MNFEGAMVAGFFFFMFLIFLLTIGGFAFWLWMIIDCVQRDFKDKNERVIWILILLFVQIIGAIVYYFVVKQKTKKSKKAKKRGNLKW